MKFIDLIPSYPQALLSLLISGVILTLIFISYVLLISKSNVQERSEKSVKKLILEIGLITMFIVFLIMPVIIENYLTHKDLTYNLNSFESVDSYIESNKFKNDTLYVIKNTVYKLSDKEEDENLKILYGSSNFINKLNEPSSIKIIIKKYNELESKSEKVDYINNIVN